MANHFQAICQSPILLLTIFTAIATTHQIQGRPLNTKQDHLKQPHTSSQVLPLHSSLGVGFRESDVDSKDDFRPTTPGNSPGVGHHAVKRSGAAAVNRSADYMEGLKDDFRPTMPGHSPGIGHAVHRIASKPNA